MSLLLLLSNAAEPPVPVSTYDVGTGTETEAVTVLLDAGLLTDTLAAIIRQLDDDDIAALVRVGRRIAAIVATNMSLEEQVRRVFLAWADADIAEVVDPQLHIVAKISKSVLATLK